MKKNKLLDDIAKVQEQAQSLMLSMQKRKEKKNFPQHKKAEINKKIISEFLETADGIKELSKTLTAKDTKDSTAHAKILDIPSEKENLVKDEIKIQELPKQVVVGKDEQPEWKKKILQGSKLDKLQISQKPILKNVKEDEVDSRNNSHIKDNSEENGFRKNLLKSASKILEQISGDVSVEQKLWNLMAQDEIAQDKELLETFLAEALDLNAEVAGIFRELKDNNTENINKLKRGLHTLKGSAKMIGANAIGEQFHSLETALESLEIQSRYSTEKVDMPKEAEVLEVKFLQVQKMIDWLENPPAHLLGISETVIEVQNKKEKDGVVTKIEKAPAVNISPVRVSSMVLDNLINQASEARLAVTNIFESNGLLNFYIQDLSDGINRLAKMLRELELHTEVQMQSRRIQVEESGAGFDPLEFDRFDRLQELTRFLAEGFGDLLDIQQDFNHVLTEQEAILYNEERTIEDIQQNLANTRLINFGQSSGRFQRIVSQTASELNKKVKLFIEGDDIELDRALLEKINTPIEHLLRNSIAHGIETPANRIKAGKAEQGIVKIQLKQNEGRMFLEIIDDGAGIDLEKVKNKAIEKGLINAQDVLNENQIIDLIFMPGFSTAETVSQIAGRGVGMDVVKSEVLGIGGRLDTMSNKGKGLKVIIEFPATLSSMTALLIEDNEQVWGFPVKYLEEVIYLNEEKIKEAYANGLTYENNPIKLYYFPHLAGFFDNNVEIKNYNYVVVFREGRSFTAIHVPNLVGTKEVQVKPLGKAFTRINGLQGAFIMPDGDVGYMVEPLRMLTDKMIKIPNMDNMKVNKKYTILVVDDSLVIRKATSRFLVREGFDVLTAKNGEEGLEVIQEKLPDLILLDVEMPKMDGFEFTKHLREHNNNKYNSVPIIMITSRTADKHKEHALSLGVNEYLGKPYKEEELIHYMNKILNKS